MIFYFFSNLISEHLTSISHSSFTKKNLVSNTFLIIIKSTCFIPNTTLSATTIEKFCKRESWASQQNEAFTENYYSNQ